MIEGSPRDYDSHPLTAKLVVEIADSSLRYDRTVKASLYASARIREYWVVNLQAGLLEVFRAPKADSTQPFGFGYSDVRTLKKKESIVPLAAKGGVAIMVADMLP